MVPVSLKKFKVKLTKKDPSPFEQLHMFVAKELGGLPEGKSIDVSMVGIVPEDYDRLAKLTMQWIKKKLPYLNAGRIKSEYSMLNLCIGPRSLGPELEAGFAYVEMPVFVDKRTA